MRPISTDKEKLEEHIYGALKPSGLGIASFVEAPTFAAIRVTAHNALIINTVLTVIPGESLRGIEAAKHSPPRKPNGG